MSLFRMLSHTLQGGVWSHWSHQGVRKLHPGNKMKASGPPWRARQRQAVHLLWWLIWVVPSPRHSMRCTCKGQWFCFFRQLLSCAAIGKGLGVHTPSGVPRCRPKAVPPQKLPSAWSSTGDAQLMGGVVRVTLPGRTKPVSSGRQPPAPSRRRANQLEVLAPFKLLQALLQCDSIQRRKKFFPPWSCALLGFLPGC